MAVRSGRTWPFNVDDDHGEERTTIPGAAMADPKQQQRLRLPEMEVLLHGVRVDLARRPSGEPLTPLLRPSVRVCKNLPGQGLIRMPSLAARLRHRFW
jgi:hypothetical protein